MMTSACCPTARAPVAQAWGFLREMCPLGFSWTTHHILLCKVKAGSKKLGQKKWEGKQRIGLMSTFKFDLYSVSSKCLFGKYEMPAFHRMISLL